MTLLLWLILFFSGPSLFPGLFAHDFRSKRDFLPVIVFTTGLVLLLEHILIREKQFTFLSVTRVVRALITQGGALLFSLVTASYLGLLGSYFTGLLVSSTFMIYINRNILKNIVSPFHELKATAAKYKKFPLVDTPSVLISTIANELPVLMIPLFHSDKYIGIYAVAYRLIKAPISIFSTAFFEVYYQKGAELHLSSPEKLQTLFKTTVLKMTIVAGGAGMFVLLAAESIARIYLGSGWGETALVMKIIVFWLVIECTYNSVSASFFITNKVEVLFYLNCVMLLIRIVAMYMARHTPVAMLTSLAITSAITYVINIVCAYKVIQAKNSTY